MKVFYKGWPRYLIAGVCMVYALSAQAFVWAIANLAAGTAVRACEGSGKKEAAGEIPSIPLFGTWKCVYGVDLGTFGWKTECVNGLAVRFAGGGAEKWMNGIEVGAIGTGRTKGEHFLESCVNGLQAGGVFSEAGMVNGIQVGGLMSEAETTVNGIQVSGVVAKALRVNGIQIGLGTKTDELRGLQIGLFTWAKNVKGAQIGLINRREGAPCEYLPLLRVVID